MIKSIFGNFSARLSGAIMNFFMLLLTTHALGREVRGEISILQLSINMIHLISDIVGGPALVYLVPRTKLKTLLLTGWAWSAFSCAAIGTILIQLGMLPAEYGREVLFASFLLSLNSINLNILLGQERIRQYNILLVLQGSLMFLTMAVSVFILKHEHATPYLEACYFGYGFTFLIGFYLVLKHKHAPVLTENRPILMVLFANGFFTQIATLTHQLSLRENYFYLDKIIPDQKASVGIYSTALSLGEAILLFSASVAAVLMSRVSNEKMLDVSRIKALRLSKLSLAVTIPGVIVFSLLPPEFYSWLLGKDFSGVQNIFLTIAPGIIMVSFGTVFGHFFSGSGKHYMNFLSGIFGLSITLITIQGMIMNYGVLGAGWTASMAYGAMSLFIFVAFMINGGKNKGEWKELLPSKNDFTSIKQLFSHKENQQK